MDELSNLMVESLGDLYVIIGGGDGRGRETPQTRIFINIEAADGQGNRYDIALGLTPTQMSEVVIGFFYEVIADWPLAAKWIKRLLGKRWATMTDGVYKRGAFGRTATRYQDNEVLANFTRK